MHLRAHRVGELVSFVPFCHARYINNWPSVRIRDGAADAESDRRGFLDNTALWWSNGGTVGCLQKTPVWGSFFVNELVGILRGLAKRVGNAEFFLNKRDHPLLRRDRREPYAQPFGPGEPPSIFSAPEWTSRARSPYDVFAPIFSFYTNSEYEDLPFPVTQDWVPQPIGAEEVPWENRVACAFFRGSASGYGITMKTNPRLKLASMDNPEKGRDFKLTSWNTRLKFQPDGTVGCIRPELFPFEASKDYFVPMERQMQYRYIVYVDGNVGASRLGALLSLGSTVIVVKSALPCVWLLRKAVPMIHYIPAADVSSIPTVLKWCVANEQKCREVAAEGKKLVENLPLLAEEFASKFLRRISNKVRSGE